MNDDMALAHVTPDLPSGTVTFLFTDIEGSTSLLQQLGSDHYGEVLADHRRILRTAFANWNGQEVDTQGDSFFVSFSRATEAVSAAEEIQRALFAHTWPDDVNLRVRMGLHTGEPIKAEEGYVGMDVHRAARIAHVGHGGQVLLSETTAALVLDDLPQGVTFIDLGRHLLKDMRRPEHIRQLVIDGLPGEFPPLNSLEKLPSAELREPRHVGECPYRGLAAFREQDAQFFYGRETFTEQLEAAVKTKPLMAVIVGSSGSGKSSAVYAGLLPRLRGEGGWQIAVIRPGNQPFYALGNALLPLLAPELSETDQLVEIQKLSERLTAGEVNLYRVVERILEKREHKEKILLVIDQFEELYTLCSDADIRQRFIDEVLATEKASGERRPPPVAILLTMRADFMGQALAYRPFADALQASVLLMGPMSREELRKAIEKPAEIQGAAFEPGLVERILEDVGESPGRLPLLEFTLTLLWERQDDGWLTHADYEAIGSVEGALASYADQVVDRFDPEEKEQVRRALVQLVRPGEGTEDTRRLARRDEIGEDHWAVIRALADQRLVVTGSDAEGRETVEVVHEALIQKWGRFREWMDADRSFRIWQDRMRVNMRQWEESDHDEGALLTGAPLSVAEQWLEERYEDVTQAGKAYINASLAMRESQQIARERRRRRTVLALSGGVLVLAAISVFAFLQRQNSLRQAAILLAGQAEAELAEGYHDRAVLLALSALESFPYTPQAEHALGQTVSYSRALEIYSEHEGAVTSAAWSPDGTWIASTGSTENAVRIWDPETGDTARTIDLPTGITGNVFDMALCVRWSLDGKTLLVVTGDRYTLGSQDYVILEYDAATGDELDRVRLANQAEPVSGELGASFVNYSTSMLLDVNPSDGRLATVAGDNNAVIWDSSTKSPETLLVGHTDAVASVSWSPEGDRLVTASMDGTARLWNSQDGDSMMVLDAGDLRLNLAVWSPDETLVATGGEDGTLRLWETNVGDLVLSAQTGSEIFSAVWSNDGERIVTGQADGSLQFWDVNSGELLEILRGHIGIISTLAWSSAEDHLASGDGSGSVRIWNAAVSTAWRVLPYHFLQGLDWSQDSKLLALGGGDMVGGLEPGFTSIWDVEANQPVVEGLTDHLNYMAAQVDLSPDDSLLIYTGSTGFPDFSGFKKAYIIDPWSGATVLVLESGDDLIGMGSSWSPDGTKIAAGTFGQSKVIIWDAASGKIVQELIHAGPNAPGGIDNTEWSPDGSRLAASGVDGYVSIWDTTTWALIHHLEGGIPPAEAWYVAWSPDGSLLVTTSGNDESGAKDKTIRIWNAETGEKIREIQGHNKVIFAATWAPNGERIVSASNDGTIRVWDIASGDELLRLRSPVDYGISAIWSPDGKHIAIYGNNSLISVWRAWQSYDELLGYAKECCIIRELTSDERQQFGLSPLDN